MDESNQPIKLFCLSGLGVDERAFVNFHPKGIELIHIPWIAPLHKESLKNYAHRLFETVDFPEKYYLLGVSFGGMIAVEMSQIRPPKCLFLISSVIGRQELPWRFRIGKYLPLHRFLPDRGLISGNRVVRHLFSVRNPKETDMLKRILGRTDPHFLYWAMNAIVLWKGCKEANVIRIHGDKDRMIPMPKAETHAISGAGHFMLVNRAAEIEQIVQNYLFQKS